MYSKAYTARKRKNTESPAPKPVGHAIDALLDVAKEAAKEAEKLGPAVAPSSEGSDPLTAEEQAELDEEIRLANMILTCSQTFYILDRTF
jgi:hypothetical protein